MDDRVCWAEQLIKEASGKVSKNTFVHRCLGVSFTGRSCTKEHQPQGLVALLVLVYKNHQLLKNVYTTTRRDRTSPTQPASGDLKKQSSTKSSYCKKSIRTWLKLPPQSHGRNHLGILTVTSLYVFDIS